MLCRNMCRCLFPRGSVCMCVCVGGGFKVYVWGNGLKFVGTLCIFLWDLVLLERILSL